MVTDASASVASTLLAVLRHRPLPTAAEALDLPFRAFPSWFLRIECDRCGKVTMLNEAHMILSYCSLSSNRPHGYAKLQARPGG